MRRFDGVEPEPDTGRPSLAGASVALGNFDGVHRGHQALIAGARAARPEAPLGVVTFEPHPREVFRPDDPPFRLTTDGHRARLLAALGVERLAVLGFDRNLSRLAPASFVTEMLQSGLGVAHVTVGADFRFGRGRLGTPAMLAALGRASGIGVTVLPLVGDETVAEIAPQPGMDDGETGDDTLHHTPRPSGQFSSTAARRAIAEGRMAEAAAILGRPHAVTGPVVQGDQRGRDLGYPTANLAFGSQMIPAHGVYATRVRVLEGPHAGAYDGVASIGERPTFGVNAPNFEVHLFDFRGDLYGAEIEVDLIALLRGEIAFDGAAALIAQMDRDSAEARAILGTPA
ncbi:MAG: bifunctional riboflavin kinase/FAD synthetase [Pseudomonadota bacterium]